jgi:hypothetical protein
VAAVTSLPPFTTRSFGLALEESLSSFLSLPIQHQVITQTLSQSGFRQIPQEGPGMQIFIQTLRKVLEQQVGHEVAGAVTAELMPFCSLAPAQEDTLIRRRRKNKRSYEELKEYTTQELRKVLSTRPPPLIKVSAVIVASADGQRIAQIRRCLGRRREVQAVIDLLSLVDFVEKGPVLLIVDFAAPTIQFTTLTTLAADLPAGSVVILWGAPTDETILSGASAVARHWYRCSGEAEPEDIAALCTLVLEDPT